MGKQNRLAKARLLTQIQELDSLADADELDDEGWALRYHLEDELMNLIRVEEEYWRQRGRQQWLLKGDADRKSVV